MKKHKLISVDLVKHVFQCSELVYKEVRAERIFTETLFYDLSRVGILLR